MKEIFAWFFRMSAIHDQKDLAKPFFHKAHKAVMENDLHKAVAFLSRGINIAPDELKLYLKRAQIHQYGLNDYSQALRDYQYIMRKLDHQPKHEFVQKCKQGMKDMM